MKFDLKLFVLVGVLAGFRDVYGTEDNGDDVFVVAGLEKNEKLSAAIGNVSIIKAVYQSDYVGDVPIIQENFRDQLSSIVVWDGEKGVTVQEFKATNTASGPKNRI